MWWRGVLVAGAILAAVLIANSSSSHTIADADISLTPSAHEIATGHHVVLRGRVTGGPTSTRVNLYRTAYPNFAPVRVASARTNDDGSFQFITSPDRDTRYQVRLVGGDATAGAAVDVDGRVRIQSGEGDAGRASVRVVVF